MLILLFSSTTADHKNDMGIFIELFPFDDVEENLLEKQKKRVNRIKRCV